MQFREAFRHLPVQIIKIGEDFLSRWIFNTFVLCFRVLVEAEIVIVFHDLTLRHQKALISTGALFFRVEVSLSLENVGNVVVLLVRVTLVVERVSVTLHVVEPNLVRAARVRLCEHENSGAYARIRLEYS